MTFNDLLSVTLLHLFGHFLWEKAVVAFSGGFVTAVFARLGLETFGGFAAAFGFAGRGCAHGKKQQKEKCCSAVVFHVLLF